MESTGWSADGRAALAGVGVLTAVLDSVTGACADADGGGPSGAGDAGPPGASVRRDADPLRELADDCLDGLAEVARWEARAAALKVRLAATYLRATEAVAAPAVAPHDAKCQEMAVTAEVACVLTVSERTAGAFVSDCQALTRGLPLTLAALTAGTISWAHARIIVDETSGLDPAGAAGLEAHFLDPAAPDPARGCPAGELVPSRFRAKARTWRERHHRDSIETRHTKSAADRRVEYRPDSDGMAWFSAYLPADTAAGIWDRTTAAARALQGPDEVRTLTQLRADIAATWLLTSGLADGEVAGGGVPSPRAQVLITVPVLSLLGAGEEPAVLDGYGPIPPSMARRLIAEGADSFYRVLVDPRDGAPLEIGRSSYRVPKAVRQWLRLRDGKCPFPGCNNQFLDNDADHLLAWADGGTTGISNLGQPCRKHHGLKHSSAWTPAGASKDAPPGWTSPSGRHYPSEQQDWEPPHWPPGILETNGLLGWEQPEDPGPDPDSELPPDPFPDWHLFTAGHTFRAADNRASDWLQPFDESVLEYFLVEAL
ncbi:HNH endonuclease signature motif containing protein [Pseudarthrobacter sp. ATCC 49987]|uniref:HNH endonuclease signature motif containing protein n=1 Tax=Pseudarthrobacter sp. ATCC 49987 TaxID=2698204 RepID=UPI00136AF476|nr:HNH endonuclease signature motif containing protein [Pseudarthrobacter sp. ATCC 49987]